MLPRKNPRAAVKKADVAAITAKINAIPDTIALADGVKIKAALTAVVTAFGPIKG